MGRIGVFLLAGMMIVLLCGYALKPAMDKLYSIMSNTTSFNLSATEDVIWQFMPYIIPAVLFGIAVAFLTGKIGGHRDEGDRE